MGWNVVTLPLHAARQRAAKRNSPRHSGLGRGGERGCDGASLGGTARVRNRVPAGAQAAARSL